MEENKKKNKGIIVLVIVLIICLIGLIGFVIYSNLSNSNHNNMDNKATTTTTTVEQKTNDSELDIYYNKINNDNDILIFNKEDLISSANLVFNEKFTNIEIEISGIKFSFTCDSMEEFIPGDNYCDSYHIIVNDAVKLQPTGQDYYIVITDSKVIIQNYDQQPLFDIINIYDKTNGNLYMSMDNSYFDLNSSFGLIKIYNNELYYLGSDDEDIQNMKKLSTYRVNLDNNNVPEIVDTINYKR